MMLAGKSGLLHLAQHLADHPAQGVLSEFTVSDVVVCHDAVTR
jgi:hypothetical protein